MLLLTLNRGFLFGHLGFEGLQLSFGLRVESLELIALLQQRRIVVGAGGGTLEENIVNLVLAQYK